ncbi:hypothetical protein JXA34_01980 [Patescibacteria group bacterium]|nr:hypothetical protein [Patescibacteria group bacterium]
MGPALIFDKSTLESLNIDEAIWLEHLFICNITPLFYVESLSDLHKTIGDGRTSEKIVKDLAYKTPEQGAVNIAHHTLILQDFLGNPVPMDGRPIVGGGETRIDTEGKIGVYHDQFPEMEAFSRWQNYEFREVEQKFAKDWRNLVSNLDFDYTIVLVKNTVPVGTKLSNIQDVKNFSDKFITGSYKELIQLALDILGMPTNYYDRILSRWEREGKPALNVFAPYAAFCFKVDIFFYLCLHKSYIAKERPSNKIDLSYLYYLPFCNVFTSKDSLHRRIAPLFMENGQSFVWGPDMKTSLSLTDQEFMKFPDEVKRRGVMCFATYPPDSIETEVSKMWDQYCSAWRKHKSEKENPEPRDPEEDKRLVEHLNNLEKNSQRVPNSYRSVEKEPDHMVFKRKVRAKKGKWSMFPPEVLDNIPENS